MKANGLLKCLSAMSLKSFVFIPILTGLLAWVPCPAVVGQGRDEVALLTTRAAYQQLAPEIEQYKRDVEARFPVQLGVIQGDWSKPGEVRATVKDLYEAKKISGVVLVGAMPMHRFFMHEHANPNPLFYEDFNLEFIDRNKDGFDDAYVGKPAPKVWVANIRSTEKSGDDGVEGLRRFFAKAHNLREGKLHYERRAIVVTDAESAETLVESKLGRHLFGAGGVDVLGAGANTLEGVRKAFAKRAYAICMMGVHSDWTGHALEGGDLCATEIAAMKTGALFTISHGCFTGNWGSSGSCVLFLDKAWTELPHLGLSHDSKWRATRVHVSTLSSVRGEGLQIPVDRVRERASRLRDRAAGRGRVVFPMRLEGRRPPREGDPVLPEPPDRPETHLALRGGAAGVVSPL